MIKDFLRKYKNAAKSALYFVKKHPELKKELIDKNKLKIWQRFILIIYILFPIFKKIQRFKVIYWKLKRRYYFEKGLK